MSFKHEICVLKTHVVIGTYPGPAQVTMHHVLTSYLTDMYSMCLQSYFIK